MMLPLDKKNEKNHCNAMKQYQKNKLRVCIIIIFLSLSLYFHVKRVLTQRE